MYIHVHDWELHAHEHVCIHVHTRHKYTCVHFLGMESDEETPDNTLIALTTHFAQVM